MAFAPQFWAEDGSVFFQQAYNRGIEALLAPYAGYLHAYPRLVAALVVPLPLAWAPALYAGASAAVFALVMWTVWQARVTALERAAMMLLAVAVPHSGEVFLNLTNAQWPLSLVLAAALLIDPEDLSRRRFVMLVALIILAGLTGPFCLLALPAWLLVWITGPRGRRATTLFGVLVVCAIIQFATLLANPRVDPVTAQGIVPGGSLLRAIGRFFHELLLHYAAPTPVAIVVASAVILLAMVGGVRSARARPVSALCLVAAGVFAAALYVFRTNPSAISAFGNGARYFFIPFVCLSWAIVLSLNTQARGAQGGRGSRRAECHRLISDPMVRTSAPGAALGVGSGSPEW
jgi:hypothetical protein